MGDKTHIEWTDATWNPIVGCSRVSRGCGGPGKAGGCYAEVMAGRIANAAQARLRAGAELTDAMAAYRQVVRWHFGGVRPVDEHDVAEGRWNGRTAVVRSAFRLPFTWRTPRRVFVDSMGDLFHESVPDGVIMDVLRVMYSTPHRYQVLTKRPDRCLDFLRRWADVTEGDGEPIMARDPAAIRERHTAQRAHLFADMLETWGEPPPGAAFPLYDWMEGPRWWGTAPNILFGFSAEDQPTFDERWSHMRQVAALGWRTWVSLEPLLGPVNLPGSYQGAHGVTVFPPAPGEPALSWVVAGGESGPGARPCHPDWARAVRDQCKAAGVPFLWKQWGEWRPFYDCGDDPDSRNVPDCRPKGRRWLNLAGGHGFHGDRVVAVERVGKKAAGRLLDGVLHDEYPEAA